jgi:predicted ATP-grasp superfamily ATP-dependent carboligase
MIHAAADTEPRDDVWFPVVIKPSRSVIDNGPVQSKANVLYASDAWQLHDALRLLPSGAFPVLFQERIESPGIAISVLVWNGELRAAFTHRRLREKSPSGGVSVWREEIELSPDLLTRSLALLREFEWQGVAMVECKQRERTGEPYLMESNGCRWGSLQLAIDAGVDFPMLLVRAALGDPDPLVTQYQVGCRRRREWGDVDHLITVLLHARASLALPPGAPHRVRTLANFFATSGSAARAEVFRITDPLPFVRESLNWVRRR